MGYSCSTIKKKSKSMKPAEILNYPQNEPVP